MILTIGINSHNWLILAIWLVILCSSSVLHLEHFKSRQHWYGLHWVSTGHEWDSLAMGQDYRKWLVSPSICSYTKGNWKKDKVPQRQRSRSKVFPVRMPKLDSCLWSVIWPVLAIPELYFSKTRPLVTRVIINDSPTHHKAKFPVLLLAPIRKPLVNWDV